MIHLQLNRGLMVIMEKSCFKYFRVGYKLVE